MSYAKQTPTTESPLLIFDLDGTLYKTETSFLPAITEIFQYHQLAAPPSQELLPFIGEPFDRLLQWLAVRLADSRGPSLTPQRLHEYIARRELQYVKTNGKLYPAVADTLTELRKRRYGISLCTNGGETYARTVLRTFRIESLFDFLRFRGSEDEGKPGMVRSLLEAAGASQAIVIGDRYHDLMAAQENGCAAIGVSYGYARPGELADADARLDSFDNLPELLVSLPVGDRCCRG